MSESGEQGNPVHTTEYPNALAHDGALGLPLTDELRGPSWQAFMKVPLQIVDMVEKHDLPDAPGVYAWFRAGRPIYVGMASSVRKRIWTQHLSRGVNLSGSALRRNVCDHLFHIPPTATSNPNHVNVTQAQASAIRDWLRTCELIWAGSPTPEQARELRDELRIELGAMLDQAASSAFSRSDGVEGAR